MSVTSQTAKTVKLLTMKVREDGIITKLWGGLALFEYLINRRL